MELLKNIDQWLDSHGLATVLVLGGAIVFIGFAWRIVRWCEPYAAQWWEARAAAENAKEQSYRESVATWKDVAKSTRMSAEAELQALPLAQDTNTTVHAMNERANVFSEKQTLASVQALEQLSHLKRNHTTFAHAAIVSVEALIDVCPEHSERLQVVLKTLREVG